MSRRVICIPRIQGWPPLAKAPLTPNITDCRLKVCDLLLPKNPTALILWIGWFV
jgi:hypothetical protein